MNKKKVAIIFTGGTISMTVDEKVGAAIPTLSGEQIMSMVTNIDKVADIEVCNFAEIPGPHMTPERLIELKHYVNNLLEREDICGAVITHGTDSLEETAYFLDLTISSQKPVIVTGAMRSIFKEHKRLLENRDKQLIKKFISLYVEKVSVFKDYIYVVFKLSEVLVQRSYGELYHK